MGEGLQRLIRKVPKLTPERRRSLSRIALRRMPPSIYGRRMPAAAAVPVFAQHAPGPQYLRPKARYLAENGYDAIATDRYAAWLAGAWSPSRPSVMLTFDDGLRRFGDVTFPILRDQGFESVLFVCPGLVDIASSREGPLADFVRRHVLTWAELAALQATGLVDIQSHGLWHNRAATGDAVVATIDRTPNNLFNIADLLPPDGRLEQLLNGGGRVARFDSEPMFMVPPAGSGPVTEDRIYEDLAQSKARIEARIPAQTVRAFAFPWWNGTPFAVGAAARAGYPLVFRGLAGIGRKVGPGSIDPMCVGRLGFDWISCLPGRDRVSVGRLLADKLRGRHADDVN